MPSGHLLASRRSVPVHEERVVRILTNKACITLELEDQDISSAALTSDRRVLRRDAIAVSTRISWRNAPVCIIRVNELSYR